jgi:hypothetical protein
VRRTTRRVTKDASGAETVAEQEVESDGTQDVVVRDCNENNGEQTVVVRTVKRAC